MELGDENGINAGENNTKAAVLTRSQPFSLNKCSSEYYKLVVNFWSSGKVDFWQFLAVFL